MTILKRTFILLSTLFITASCGEPNVLTEFSKTDSDEALFLDAQKLLDEMKWADTLDILENQLSVAYRARNDVKDMRASAYAGRCGLTLFTFAANLGTSDSMSIFNFFMAGMKNKIVAPSDCNTARDIIVNTHGNVNQRTTQQNFNLAILGMAKAGAFLRANLDQDNAGLGDGIVDAGKDVCSAADVSDADVVEIVTGLGLIIENFAAVSSQLGGGTVTIIDDLNTACGIAIGFPGPAVTCDFTDAAFIGAHITEFRSILNADGIGVSSCNLGDTPFRACPCDGN